MSFFDDKQEILKVELTTYGRYLLSRGKFKPTYYAFFDDDVLYDSEYANLSESQNDPQTRILEETINMKPQTTFTSLENVVKVNALTFENEERLKQEEAQIQADKNYALSLPLAQSALSVEYAPSWALRLLNGKISSIADFIDNSSGSYNSLQPYLKYPQITLDTNVYDIKRTKNSLAPMEGYKTVYDFSDGSSNYRYLMNEQPILIDLKENNVIDALKNFDVEVFLEEEEVVLGTGEVKNTLRQLNFKKQTVEIENGLLLDEPKTFLVDETDDFVEYFFELTVDDEIDLPPQQRADAKTYTGEKNKPPFGVDC